MAPLLENRDEPLLGLPSCARDRARSAIRTAISSGPRCAETEAAASFPYACAARDRLGAHPGAQSPAVESRVSGRGACTGTRTGARRACIPLAGARWTAAAVRGLKFCVSVDTVLKIGGIEIEVERLGFYFSWFPLGVHFCNACIAPRSSAAITPLGSNDHDSDVPRESRQ
jgi:hypothetical protein